MSNEPIHSDGPEDTEYYQHRGGRPVEEWDRLMAVNLRGLFLRCCAVVPHMKQQRRGKIVNISSGTVFYSAPLVAHYMTSKAPLYSSNPCLTPGVAWPCLACLPVFILPLSYCSPAHLPRGDAEAKMCFILPSRRSGSPGSAYSL